MRPLRLAFLAYVTLLCAPVILAQGYTASLVDLGSRRVVAHFPVGNAGDNPVAVAWGSNTAAYVINEVSDDLVRVDMTVSPPIVNATFAFPAGQLPHAIAVNPAGTRALVTVDNDADTIATAYLLNLMTNPFSIIDTVTLPSAGAGGVAFYSSGTKALVVNENNLLLLDLGTVPAGVTTVPLGNPGLAVAINATHTRAVVTIDTGGLQTINLTTFPPTLIGSPVGPSGMNPLGVDVSPNGATAVYVDEDPFPGEANIVSISGTPSLVNSIPIFQDEPSAVAFNPVTAAAYIATDSGVLVIDSPYTVINTTIEDPGYSGATAFSIAVNPAGTFAIVLDEDRPPIPNTASLLNLTTNTVTTHFVVGDNPAAVAWSGNSVAYVVNDEGNNLVRVDMTLPTPAISANFLFPPGFDPHGLAINPAGTRALVTGDTTSVYLLNLTTVPFSIVDTITVPVVDANGVAFYSGGTRAVVVNEDNLLFLDLSTIPAGVTTVSLGGNFGQAVAVNAASSRAVVTIDSGGMQTVNLMTNPPSLVGSPVGALDADPLGVAVSPDGTRAVYVDEEFPAGEANVVDISAAPALLNTVPLPLSSPSAVAFNPVSAAALIAGDNGVNILNPPYTSVNATITDPDPSYFGATPYSIAVNPAGTFAIVLNEDSPAINQVTPAGLQVDPAVSGTSNGNRVLEPGETVLVEPAWTNITSSPVLLTGAASDIAGPSGATYSLPDTSASYGTLASAATGSCAATADCYSVSVSAPATRPAAHWDVTFFETLNSGDSPKSWTLHVGESFLDVPTSNLFYRFIETIFHNGITGGCGSGNYCPATSVSRAQMAVFLLKAEHRSTYVPPSCTGVFPDVPCPSLFADWIEQLFHEGITGGCGAGNYCPNNPVTRAQMAAFLLKAEHGPAYMPPICSGVFPDVPCPSLFANWIERLFNEGITGGCGGGNYCPGSANTRGQMAVFLVKTFGIVLYGP